jgi:NAD(P)-dependent dehydrogenase (short-subunit alcohol dehydrogenase family)
MAAVSGEVAGITPEEFRRATEVTHLGSVHGTMAALPHMRPRGVRFAIRGSADLRR